MALSCNPTRFFPKATVEWYIKFDKTNFEVMIKPEESNKYDTIDDGHHLIINNITESDVEDSKIYACVAFYTRLNAPYVGYYIYPRYKLEIVGKTDSVTSISSLLINRFITWRVLYLSDSNEQGYLVK